jgi:hypothetical protein
MTGDGRRFPFGANRIKWNCAIRRAFGEIQQ